VIAHEAGLTAKSVRHRAQGRCDGLGNPVCGLADPIDGLCGVSGRMAPDTLEVLLQRSQPMLDFADIGGDCAGAGTS
jgi:hypothetical protein